MADGFGLLFERHWSYYWMDSTCWLCVFQYELPPLHVPDTVQRRVQAHPDRQITSADSTSNRRVHGMRWQLIQCETRTSPSHQTCCQTNQTAQDAALFTPPAS